MSKSSELQGVPVEIIERRIYLIRGQKVMLDSDIAALYQVPTKRLNEAVKRNLDRFPEDFMFRLTKEEAKALMWPQFAATSQKKLMNQWVTRNRSQNATGSQRHRDPRFLPYAFTEHGVVMLSSVLSSERAVQMNILIVRAFVKIRELLAHNKDLAARVEKLEVNQKDHRSMIAVLAKEIDAMKRLPEPKKRPIGFVELEEKKG